MFSSPSFAGWKKVSDKVETINFDDSVWKNLQIFYVDFERIREHDGYVYWWNLVDHQNPLPGSEALSYKSYIQGDCKVFRLRPLNAFAYEELMGQGSKRDINVKEGNESNRMEQWNLDTVINKMKAEDPSFTYKNLPPEYTMIFDSMRGMYPNVIPVIEHFQASRRFKKDVNKK